VRFRLDIRRIGGIGGTHARVLWARCFSSLLLVGLGNGLAAPAQVLPQAAGLLPTITRAADIRSLSPEQADLHYPVHIQGVVTYMNPRGYSTVGEEPITSIYGPDLFIQDSTAGVWVGVGVSLVRSPPRAGEVLDLEGQTSGQAFAPYIEKPRWRVIGQAPFPVPRAASYLRLASTAEDSQWVRITGIVRSAFKSDTMLVMAVAMPRARRY